MAIKISNSEDIIDSREVIERIKDLTDQRDTFNEDPTENAIFELTDDEVKELAALVKLADEAEGYADDWRYGVTLIRETYFETYAREFAEDMHGEAIKNASWPFDSIDWEAAASDLQMDYTSVEFDGVSYWVR